MVPLDPSASPRTSFEIRPGVQFPDWKAVRSPAAAAAVQMIFDAVGIERRWRGYDQPEDQVRTAVLHHFARTGCAPTPSDLSDATGLGLAEVRGVLGRLQTRDLVLLDDARQEVRAAYPFSAEDRGYQVQLDGARLEALCAIDALGIGAMLASSTTIRSVCRSCGASVRLDTGERGTVLRACAPAETVVWVGKWYAEGCGATSLCTTIAFFCCEAHRAQWRAANQPNIDGCRLTLEQALEVGVAIFGPMLAPATRP